MVGKMRHIVTFKNFTKTKDAGGGVSKTVDDTYTLWAEVENRTGKVQFNNGQEQAAYDYKIKVRYYDEKIITTATVAEYEGKGLKINSVQRQDEGKLSYLILKCSFYGGN